MNFSKNSHLPELEIVVRGCQASDADTGCMLDIPCRPARLGTVPILAPAKGTYFSTDFRIDFRAKILPNKSFLHIFLRTGVDHVWDLHTEELALGREAKVRAAPALSAFCGGGVSWGAQGCPGTRKGVPGHARRSRDAQGCPKTRKGVPDHARVSRDPGTCKVVPGHARVPRDMEGCPGTERLIEACATPPAIYKGRA